MDYVVLHFGLARILPWLQKGFSYKNCPVSIIAVWYKASGC